MGLLFVLPPPDKITIFNCTEVVSNLVQDIWKRRDIPDLGQPNTEKIMADPISDLVALPDEEQWLSALPALVASEGVVFHG